MGVFQERDLSSEDMAYLGHTSHVIMPMNFGHGRRVAAAIDGVRAVVEERYKYLEKLDDEDRERAQAPFATMEDWKSRHVSDCARLTKPGMNARDITEFCPLHFKLGVGRPGR